jgi:hypothetical protein
MEALLRALPAPELGTTQSGAEKPKFGKEVPESVWDT